MAQTVASSIDMGLAGDKERAGGQAPALVMAPPDVATAMRREQNCIHRALPRHTLLKHTICGDAVRDPAANIWALGVGAQAGRNWVASLEGRPTPSMLISMGLAGGLVHGYRLGDVVLSERLLIEGELQTFHSDPRLLGLAAQACQHAGLVYHVGDILTVHEAACTPSHKLGLGRQTGAIACSMEDYWLAQEAHRMGVPFLSARVVLDPAEKTLPPFVAELAHHGGAALVVGAVMRWWRLPDLIVLARQAGRAQRRLEAFANAFWSKLPATMQPQPTLSTDGERVW